MAEYIDKQDAIDIFKQFKRKKWISMPIEQVIEIISVVPYVEAEPVKQTIEKFRDYQIEWLTAHNDIEFCEEEENLIIRFLKDTAECAIKLGMDEVEE